MGNVDYGHKRHKCSICGSTRFEKFVKKIKSKSFTGEEIEIKTRYGKQCWVCVDNPDCRHRVKNYRSY